MSPQTMVNLQTDMGKEHDAKLQVWKREVEQNESALMLLQEIISKQLLQLADDDMDLNRLVDMKEETLQPYTFYNKGTFNYCLSVIKTIMQHWNEYQMTEDVLNAALDFLRGQEIFYYK